MMNSMKWLVCVVLLFPPLAEAGTTYYVSNSTANGWAVGSDSNACTLTSAPCLTIAGGITKMSSGDTLTVNDGTYSDSINGTIPGGGGTEATRTIVRCQGYRTCTVSGSTLWNFRFLDETDSWITLKDFVLTNPGTVNVALNSTSGTADTHPHHVRIEGNEIKNSPIYCMYTGHGRNNEFLNNYIHDCGEQNVYMRARDAIFRGNIVCCNTHATQQAITLHRGGGLTPSGNLIEGNLFYDFIDDAIELCIADTHTIRENVFYNISLAGIRVSAGCGEMTNSDIDHNTFYGNGYGIWIDNTLSTGNRVRNNIAVGNTTANISICSGCGTQTTNLTTGTAADLFVSHTTGDFRLKSGSAAIDGCTNISLPYNGTAPDCGAVETPTFSACSIENGDPTTIRVRMNNAAAPSLFPLTGITGFTARKNTSSHSITAAVANGTDYAFLTVGAIAAGDTVDISYSAGTLASQTLVGNQYNQAYLGTLTNQSCTNNLVGGGGGGGSVARGAKGLGLF